MITLQENTCRNRPCSKAVALFIKLFTISISLVKYKPNARSRSEWKLTRLVVHGEKGSCKGTELGISR